MSFFKVIQKSKLPKSRARIGTITTAHGVINTPAFVSVGTKGTVKSMLPSIARNLGVQASFVNTYHLVTHPGAATIKKHNSIHEFSGMNWPLFSDSGGFQIFSLAGRAKRGKLRDGHETVLVSLKEDRVVFRSIYNGELIEFSPELSMKYQTDIGADMCMAFDECVYYGATEKYARNSMEMTHRWLERCTKHFETYKRSDYPQYIYGIIQGATFENLRIESAKIVVAQNTPGVAIGGVSVGESKKELRDQVAWVAPYLPDDRPVHLLGVGQLDDIFDLVSSGIDTFDCVEATRLARLGVLFEVENMDKNIDKWVIKKKDIMELDFKDDITPVFGHDEAAVLGLEFGTFTHSFLHHLFKQKELLGYTIATAKNLVVMERVMSRIREQISSGQI